MSDAVDDQIHLGTIGEQLQHVPISKKLEDVIEMTSDPAPRCLRGVTDQALSGQMDENELLQQRASRVKHRNDERLKVGELAEIGSGSSQGIAEEATDVHQSRAVGYHL